MNACSPSAKCLGIRGVVPTGHMNTRSSSSHAPPVWLEKPQLYYPPRSSKECRRGSGQGWTQLAVNANGQYGMRRRHTIEYRYSIGHPAAGTWAAIRRSVVCITQKDTRANNAPETKQQEQCTKGANHYSTSMFVILMSSYGLSSLFVFTFSIA